MIEDLVYFINELLGVFLNLGTVESRGIHPRQIHQTRGHSSNLLVCSGYNLPISLGCHGLSLCSSGLCLSSNGLGHLEKSSHYGTIRKTKIGWSLVIIIFFFKKRDLISKGKNSRIGNLFLKYLCQFPSSIHCL